MIRKTESYIKKGLLFTILVLITLLLVGCNSQLTHVDFAELPSQIGTYMESISANQSMFAPGETAIIMVDWKDEEINQTEATLEVFLVHLNDIVYTSKIPLKDSENSSIEFEVLLPNADYTGYLLEVFLVSDQNCLDYQTLGIDVSSTWNVFPRYGYLSQYGSVDVEATLSQLNTFYLNGLMYYDVIDRHDQSLAGTVDKPSASWRTISNDLVLASTIQDMIDTGHTYHMNSYVYELMFGAYEDFSTIGIQASWGLYKDSSHALQDYHPLPTVWETSKLYLFNPANLDWQNNWTSQVSDLLEVYDFDGIQIDSLGNRGLLYTYDGQMIFLDETYMDFLENAKSNLNTGIIFNPVNGYGLDQTLGGDFNDIIYMEIWDGTYATLQKELFDIYEQTNGEIGTVFAAYMNYGNTTGSFNTASVLLTEATIVASGGDHLDYGDNGLLSKEYYPGDMLLASKELMNRLLSYSTFQVAYENYLRGTGLSVSPNETAIQDYTTSTNGSLGSIWTFARTKSTSEEVLHFINLLNATTNSWMDSQGLQNSPMLLEDVLVKHYIQDIPEHVYFATPDRYLGVMNEIPFEIQTDESGTYISFVLPSLEYYSMIVIK